MKKNKKQICNKYIISCIAKQDYEISCKLGDTTESELQRISAVSWPSKI